MDLKIVNRFMSLKKDISDWYNIPKFVAITGKNGCGKTHLLRCINEKIEEKSWVLNCDYKRDRVVFVPYDWRPQVNASNRDLDENTRSQFQEWVNYCEQSPQSPNHKFFPAYTQVLERLKKTELTNKEIKESFPIDFDYRLESMDHFRKYFLAFLKKKNNRFHVAEELYKKSGDSEEFKKIANEETPWDLINKLLERYGFHYRMIKPNDDDNIAAIMFKSINDDEDPRNIIDLSSGEKMIVSLVMWAHNPNTGSRVKLMLLDEPDAHLHPSMSEMMIEIIQNTLVKEYGIRVIMTTHSPTTVAHTRDSEAEIFWMENGKISQEKKPNEIIEELSSGLITVSDFIGDLRNLVSAQNKNILFTEGKTDPKYLESAAKIFKKDFRDTLFFGCVDDMRMIDFIKLPIGSGKAALLDNCADKDKAKKIRLEIKEYSKTLKKGKKIKILDIPNKLREIECLFDEDFLKNPHKFFPQEFQKLRVNESSRHLDEVGKKFNGNKNVFANTLIRIVDKILSERKSEEICKIEKIFKNFEPLLETISGVFVKGKAKN